MYLASIISHKVHVGEKSLENIAEKGKGHALAILSFEKNTNTSKPDVLNYF